MYVEHPNVYPCILILNTNTEWLHGAEPAFKNCVFVDYPFNIAIYHKKCNKMAFSRDLADPDR